MNLDEFLIAIGVKADTRPAEEMAGALDDVTDSANAADQAAQEVGGSFTRSLGSALTIVGTFAATLKTALMGAWAFLDSTIDRVEELQNAEDESIRTTKEQVAMAKEYRENMEKMSGTIDNLKTRIALGFLPAMLEMSQMYAKLLDDNKELIEKGIKYVLHWVQQANQVITNFIRFIDLVISKTIGWKGALIVLGVAFAWIKRAMIAAFITNPITWVIAAIGVLLLLIDDFMTYLDGGESKFGDFWGSMLGWIRENEDALKGIWEALVYGMSLLIEFGAYVVQYLGGAFTDAVEVVVAALTFLVGLFTGNTELMKAAWSGMIENFVSMFQNFAMLFEPLAQVISNIFVKMMDGIASALSRAYEIITAPFKAAFDWIVEKFSQLPSLIGGVVSKLTFGLSDKIGSAVSNTVNRVTNNYGGAVNANINVSSPNPQAAGKAVAANIGQANSMAARNVSGRAKA